MTKHPTIELIDSFGNVVQIDTDIASLVQWLWDHEMQTFNSCQDNFGYVWIEFTASSAEAFLGNIMELGDETLRSRACAPIDIRPEDRFRLTSDYCTWDDTWLITANASYQEGMMITVGVRFPREQLPRVKATCAI